jgi:hypothetical protein
MQAFQALNLGITTKNSLLAIPLESVKVIKSDEYKYIRNQYKVKAFGALKKQGPFPAFLFNFNTTQPKDAYALSGAFLLISISTSSILFNNGSSSYSETMVIASWRSVGFAF